MTLLIDALVRHASTQAESIACRFDDGVLNYGQLLAEVAQFSEYLIRHEIDTLAFKLDNGKAWVIADLAAQHAGVTSVPIPGFFTGAQVNHVLSASGADLLLSDIPVALTQLAEPDRIDQFPGLSVYRLTPEKQEIRGAKLTFTSGSTGQPKGVLLGTDALMNTTSGIVSALENLEIKQHLCVLPLATLLENIAGLYAPLIHGIEVHIPSLRTVGLDGASLDIGCFNTLLESSTADSMILVPQLLTALVTLSELGMVDTSHFKMIAVGGGRISQHLLKKAEAQNLKVFEGYGLSECASVLTLNLPGQYKAGSVGKPLPHVSIRISATGEIEAKGSLMRGYLGEPALPQNAWLPTGDLGHIDEAGFVYVTGRKKNLFITAFGRNVNPEWPESALTQQPAIGHALVYGEATSHNLALLWMRFPQTDEEVASLIHIANQELPDYARIHAWQVMGTPMAEAFVTSNGRLKRASLLDELMHEIEAHFARQDEMLLTDAPQVPNAASS